MIMEFLNSHFRLWGICSFEKIENNLIDCAAKKRLPQNARSVICVLFPYLLEAETYREANLSRYAAAEDYHSVASKRLGDACNGLKEMYPKEEFAFFCDNSPIPEVEAATLAGLGFRGKNGLLINPDFGSFLFIGEIVTSLKLEAKTEIRSGCSACEKCIQACPTGALQKSGFQKELCISKITQKKGQLTAGEEALLKKGGSVWGCDICQLACPLNKNITIHPEPEFTKNIKPRFSPEDEAEKRAYAWRGKETLLRNLKILQQEEEI